MRTERIFLENSRSPGHRVPWWVLIWIKRSPLVFLVLSVACFSLGLVLFAYSSGQSRVTTTLTTFFSALSCFGLAAVSTWFASERWTFSRHNGRKWLADVLSETKVRLYHTPGMKWLIYEPRALAWYVSQKIRTVFRRLGKIFGRVRERTLDQFSTTSLSAEKLGENATSVLPVSACASPELGSPVRYRPDANPLKPITEGSMTTLPISSFDGSGDDSRTMLNWNDTGVAQGGSGVNSASPGGSGKGRLKSAVRTVMLRNAMAQAQSPFTNMGFRAPRRQRTMSSDGQNGADPGMEDVSSMRGSRVASLVPKLKSMETTQDLAAHTALVRHLQFSPNGKFLATSR